MAKKKRALKRKKSAPDYMRISLYKGNFVIDDRSKNDDRYALLALMEAMGMKPEDVRMSWCG